MKELEKLLGVTTDREAVLERVLEKLKIRFYLTDLEIERYLTQAQEELKEK